MSAINNALSELSKSQTVSKSGLERAQVQVVKRTNALPWLIGGFTLSLAVGGWAISQQPVPVLEATSEVIVSQPISTNTPVRSPTTKLAQASDAIFAAPQRQSDAVANSLPTNADTVVEERVAPIVVAQRTVESNTLSAPLEQVEEYNVVAKPVLIAKAGVSHQPESVVTAQVKPALEVATGEVIVEQVELTPTQLAEKAQSRAEKSLDANDLASAINYYNDALRYTPRDSQVRQKLVALYYGKGEVRKAVDLLQKGIALSQDDMSLRISLAKLLLKEKQNTAALTPLVYLPSNPTVEYLSLRAVLAQKSAQDEMAQESYQKLVQLEPDNGRWWLGLGIQLERAFELTQATKVYQQALNKVGLSSQSQQFIRDRLVLLSRLEDQTNAN